VSNSLMGGSPTNGCLTINCDECIMQGTTTCADCVVTFICGRDPREAVVIDVAELRSMRLLADAGLLPGLRHRRRHV
jgi:hypothetical protein